MSVGGGGRGGCGVGGGGAEGDAGNPGEVGGDEVRIVRQLYMKPKNLSKLFFLEFGA